MQLSAEQDRALGAVRKWLADRGDVFRLFGYAGTGKTTIAKKLAELMDGHVTFCAFTGKAAHVMQTKGCEGATTIHSLIYRPKPKSRRRLRELQEELGEILEGGAGDNDPRVKKLEAMIVDETSAVKKPSFEINEDSKIRETGLVIIDECSMVGTEMAEDLLGFGVPILVLGDPAQLPPVKSKGYFTNARPDFMLEEIHRQAKESPIIQLATLAREKKPILVGDYGDSRVIRVRDFDRSALTDEQIIVGKNATRRRANQKRRECLGFTSTMPEESDRLICLRNNHELGLLNGAMWTVEHIIDPDVGGMMDVRLVSEDDERRLLTTIHGAPFRGEEVPYWDTEAQEFDFGYAITGHKAQGGQWPSVLLVDESSVFRNDKHRWLYTALTRASERITVVR